MTQKRKTKIETPSWWRGRRLMREGRSFAKDVRRALRKLDGELAEPVAERAGKAVLTFEELRGAEPRDWRAISAAINELERLLEGVVETSGTCDKFFNIVRRFSGPPTGAFFAGSRTK